jgi:hypothetical protein
MNNKKSKEILIRGGMRSIPPVKLSDCFDKLVPIFGKERRRKKRKLERSFKKLLE